MLKNWNSVFLGASANFGEDSRTDGIYSSGNRGVKKGPGPRGSRDEEFFLPSLQCRAKWNENLITFSGRILLSWTMPLKMMKIKVKEEEEAEDSIFLKDLLWVWYVFQFNWFVKVLTFTLFIRSLAFFFTFFWFKSLSRVWNSIFKH